MKYSFAALVLPLVYSVSNAAYGDFGCAADDEFESYDFDGRVSGDQRFATTLGIRQFVLEPTDFGWRIRVFSSAGPELPVRGALSGIPQSDPPLISGMDYVNADNTATIQGPVQRKFFFGRNAVDPVSNPELIVPGGSPATLLNAPTVEPTEGDNGIGELIIEDIGLNNVGKGRTARLTYIKFRGCLGWHKGYRGPDWRGGADPGVPDIAVSAMQQCGFDVRIYKLSDRMTGGSERGSNAYLEPDLMRDGILDFVAVAKRKSDAAMGLAICQRGDNRLTMAGFDDGADIAGFAAQADYWHLNKGPLNPGNRNPKPAGDAILMGMEKGPALLIYLDAAETVKTHRQGEIAPPGSTYTQQGP